MNEEFCPNCDEYLTEKQDLDINDEPMTWLECDACGYGRQ